MTTSTGRQVNSARATISVAVVVFLVASCIAQSPIGEIPDEQIRSTEAEVGDVVARYEREVASGRIGRSDAIDHATAEVDAAFRQLAESRTHAYLEHALPMESEERFVTIGTAVNGQTEERVEQLVLTPPLAGMRATNLEMPWRKTSGEDRRIQASHAVRDDGSAYFHMRLIEADLFEKDPRVFFRGKAVFRFPEEQARQLASEEIARLRETIATRTRPIVERLTKAESQWQKQKADDAAQVRARNVAAQEKQERADEAWNVTVTNVIAVVGIIAGLFSGIGLLLFRKRPPSPPSSPRRRKAAASSTTVNAQQSQPFHQQKDLPAPGYN